MYKFLLIFALAFSSLFASDVIHQRQESMQDFNKLMRSATQMLNSGESQGLEEIYIEIESNEKDIDKDFEELLLDKIKKN